MPRKLRRRARARARARLRLRLRALLPVRLARRLAPLPVRLARRVAPPLPVRLWARLRRRLPPRVRAMLPEIAGFALAGGAAYAADLGLFIWLRGPAGLGPLTAKALSFLAGCGVAYNGNALGTYRRRRDSTPRARRYGVFFAVNAAGAAVQLLCLVLSHYVLGFRGPRADVVSGGVVGMALATVLRFWGTRTLVFGTATRRSRGVRRADEGSRPSWTG